MSGLSDLVGLAVLVRGSLSTALKEKQEGEERLFPTFLIRPAREETGRKDGS